jgi:hypothetical protein
MPEPVNPAADFLVTRGNAREVQYREYDPAADEHGDAEECVGVAGPRRKAEEAGRAVTRRTWTLTGLTATPVLRSLVVDGDESWEVLSAEPDPASGTVTVCETVLT